MKIAFFGSSLVSAYWNGAATYYRGIIRALHQLGHRVTFYEPNAWQRQEHRDLADPDWARVYVYEPTRQSAHHALADASHADLIVKASGVGVLDEMLEEAVLTLKINSNLVVFWDVDAPATLDRIAANPDDAFAPLIPRYDAIFTYGGGHPVVNAYQSLGARQCTPIYNGLDPATHFPVPPDPRFEGDLAFLGNRLPDRESRVEDFFLTPSLQMPDRRFLLGGSGWDDKPKAGNIHYFRHVFTRDHNAFNCSPKAVLNVTRDSMARYGFSPATRVFEAAGAAACLITDAWEGVDYFFDPGTELLVAHSGHDVVEYIRSLTSAQARKVGVAALARVLARHTYRHRAEQLDAVLNGREVEMAGSLR
jgi:spore maturation protein CgeB